MADLTETELRTILLERFDTLDGFIDIERDNALDDFNGGNALAAVGHLINCVTYQLTLNRALETYFTATIIPSDDNVLLAWLRAANLQTGPDAVE